MPGSLLTYLVTYSTFFRSFDEGPTKSNALSLRSSFPHQNSLIIIIIIHRQPITNYPSKTEFELARSTHCTIANRRLLDLTSLMSSLLFILLSCRTKSNAFDQ